MSDINGLINPFENSVENQNLTQLEKEKQIRDYLEAITAFDYAVPTRIIADLNQLIAEGFVSLEAIDGFNVVLIEAFAIMTPGQLFEFTPDQLLELSPNQIAALNPEVFAEITFDLLSALSLDTLGGITASQVAQIAVDVFSQLTFQMFSALSPDALAAITPEQITEVLVDVFAVLTSDLLAELSDSTFAGLTAVQIAAFPVVEFAALTSAELTYLTPEAFAGVTAGQIAALPADVFATLSSAQITAIAPDALGGMTADQFATLDPAVLQALQDSGSVLAITSDGEEIDGDLSAASFFIVENSTSVTTVQATSPLDLMLTYSVIGGANKALFQIDAQSGALSFIDAPDYETPLGVSGNAYEVTVQVSDGLQTDTQTISVSVANDPRDDNITAPRITSDLGGDFATVQIFENEFHVTTVTSEDPDPVGGRSYSIIGGANEALFQIDAQSGALSFIDAPDYETPLGVSGNAYEVTVQVSDGLQTDTQTILVSVANDPGDDNITAPRITSDLGGDFATVQIFENEFHVTTVTSEDPDPVGGRSYSIIGGANEALFQIDTQSGALSFIHAPDYETPLGVSGNAYEVTVQVSDGLQTDTQSLTVTVLDVDEQAGPLNVQFINEKSPIPNPEAFMIFFGAVNTADIFVFDAAVFNDGFSDIQIQNFDISEDYLVFINYELGGDYELPFSDPGQFFHENSDLGFNHVNFFEPGRMDVIQDRSFDQQGSLSVLNVSGIGEPIALANSFGPGFTNSGAAVTDQSDHVLFYADGFDFL